MKKIAIVSPNKYKYSETFIHGHLLDLPFDKWLLHGAYLPTLATRELEGEDVKLRYQSVWEKFMSKQYGGEIHRKNLVRGIKKFLEKQQIELVLAEYGPTGVAMGEICTELNLPLLVHFHGYDAYRQDILADQGRFYPELFAQMSAAIVVSKDMQQQLLSLGAPTAKIKLIPYGIDTDSFSLGQPELQAPFLISVGRFTAKKAPDLLLRIFAQVLKTHPAARLTMVGQGELLPGCHLLADALGIAEQVTFAGALPPAKVASIMQQATALLQHSIRPSDGDSEGLPLSILEGMASGLPIVATRHAGIPDAVRHGVEGLLSEEGDVAAMAAQVCAMLAEPERARSMGLAGRKRALDRYTKKRYHEGLADLINYF